MDKQVFLKWAELARSDSLEAFKRDDPVVVKVNPNGIRPFRVETEKGLYLAEYKTTEEAKQFCEGLELTVVKGKEYYIESWICRNAWCGEPCTVELIVYGDFADRHTQFNRNCLLLPLKWKLPKPQWTRLPNRPYEKRKEAG